MKFLMIFKILKIFKNFLQEKSSQEISIIIKQIS